MSDRFPVKPTANGIEGQGQRGMGGFGPSPPEPRSCEPEIPRKCQVVEMFPRGSRSPRSPELLFWLSSPTTVVGIYRDIESETRVS